MLEPSNFNRRVRPWLGPGAGPVTKPPAVARA
jgi:hypothetical protein